MANTKQTAEAKTVAKAAKPTATKSKAAEAKTKAAPKKAVAPKKVATPKKTTKTSKSVEITSSERYKMIEVAAYYIAEKNNFSGNAAEYWVLAEREISQKYPK